MILTCGERAGCLACSTGYAPRAGAWHPAGLIHTRDRTLTVHAWGGQCPVQPTARATPQHLDSGERYVSLSNSLSVMRSLSRWKRSEHSHVCVCVCVCVGGGGGGGEGGGEERGMRHCPHLSTLETTHTHSLRRCSISAIHECIGGQEQEHPLMPCTRRLGKGAKHSRVPCFSAAMCLTSK